MLSVRRPFVSLAVLGVALAGAGCGSEEEPAKDSDTTIEITLEDGEVDPLGERITVERDQPIIFEIDSDIESSLHVHSSPEQTIEFGKGETSEEITIGRAGVVDVELHDPAVTVVQLEVR